MLTLIKVCIAFYHQFSYLYDNFNLKVIHLTFDFLSLSYHYRPSMSHGTGLGLDRHQERDFILSTTEEFVKRFGGTRVINKVSFFLTLICL